MHWPLTAYVCNGRSGVYAALSVCQGSGQPTRRRCVANSHLAGTLKPFFTSAVVNTVNISINHMYTQSLWISVTGASVYACAFFNDVCCRFVQTARVCAAAADMYLCYFFSLSLKGQCTQTERNAPTYRSLTSRLFWFYDFVSLYHKHSIYKIMLKTAAAAASLPRNCVSITPNMPQTSLSTVFIGTISLGEPKSNKNCLQ